MIDDTSARHLNPKLPKNTNRMSSIYYYFSLIGILCIVSCSEFMSKYLSIIFLSCCHPKFSKNFQKFPKFLWLSDVMSISLCSCCADSFTLLHDDKHRTHHLVDGATRGNFDEDGALVRLVGRTGGRGTDVFDHVRNTRLWLGPAKLFLHDRIHPRWTGWRVLLLHGEL